MEQAELAALHARAEAKLCRIPGVVGVGFGLKEVEGRTTDQVSFRVYVAAKKPRSALKADEVIPPEFEGIPTDVLLAIADEPLHCEDLARHDQLVGGISIVTRDNLELGTLGFFATIDGELGHDNVVMVSNHHVLSAGAPRRGDTVYQPALVMNPSGNVSFANPDDKHPVAKLHNIGSASVYPFTYPGEAVIDTYIDCATARLNISVSSWCNSNCGISYRNEIIGLNINGSSRISGVARIAHADIGTARAIVYKVGRRTGRTKGRVVEVYGARLGPGKVMIIEPIGLDCEGLSRFGDHGDSGSALINEQRQLVGLLFGKSQFNTIQMLGVHIHPVLAYLQVTPITEAHPPVRPAGLARADAQGVAGDEVGDAVSLRERFLATPQGAAFYAHAVEHRGEVVDLVNRCRPVTVAWHRGKGPAFLNRGINNMRHSREAIPRQIDGVGRGDLLRRMRDVLSRHGSQRLAAALDRHADEIVALAEAFDDLRDLVARFENEVRVTEQEAPCGAG